MNGRYSFQSSDLRGRKTVGEEDVGMVVVVEVVVVDDGGGGMEPSIMNKSLAILRQSYSETVQGVGIGYAGAE